MNFQSKNGQSKRKRVCGRLEVGPRGHSLLTETGDLWVLERDELDSKLIGRHVVAEGVQVGFDRLQVDWLGVVKD